MFSLLLLFKIGDIFTELFLSSMSLNCFLKVTELTRLSTVRDISGVFDRGGTLLLSLLSALFT